MPPSTALDLFFILISLEVECIRLAAAGGGGEAHKVTWVSLNQVVYHVLEE